MLFRSGSGNDRILGDYVQRADIAGHDTLWGGAGNDTLVGDSEWDGGTGNDVLDGGDGNDSLYGSGGTDVLTGGKGNNLLDAGNGNDELSTAGTGTFTGGTGTDTAKLFATPAADTIVISATAITVNGVAIPYTSIEDLKIYTMGGADSVTTSEIGRAHV